MPTYCFVRGCSSFEGQGQPSYHRLSGQNSHDLLLQWLTHADRLESEVFAQAGICENHFAETEFVCRNRGKSINGRNKLRSDAVPTLNSAFVLSSTGYRSPSKKTPVKPLKRRKSDQTVEVNEADFGTINDLIEFVPHLPEEVKAACFINYWQNGLLYGHTPLSGVNFERTISFSESLNPVISVHGQLYKGSLVSSEPVLKSEDLRVLVTQFAALRICTGLNDVAGQVKDDEIFRDSYCLGPLSFIVRSNGCNFFVPAKPRSTTRCVSCQILSLQARRRVSVVDHREKPAGGDLETSWSLKAVAKKEKRSPGNKDRRDVAAANSRLVLFQAPDHGSTVTTLLEGLQNPYSNPGFDATEQHL